MARRRQGRGDYHGGSTVLSASGWGWSEGVYSSKRQKKALLKKIGCQYQKIIERAKDHKIIERAKESFQTF
jgi:hypothetical protein